MDCVFSLLHGQGGKALGNLCHLGELRCEGILALSKDSELGSGLPSLWNFKIQESQLELFSDHW